MKKVSKTILIIMALAAASMLFYFLLPTFWIPQHNIAIMGWTSIFGGVLKNYNGGASVHYSVGNIVTLFLPLITILFAYVGRNQRSTFFFTFCLCVASCVLFGLSRKFFLNSFNTGIYGIHSAVLFVGPYFSIVISALGACVSLFGLFYKPNARLSRR